MFVRILLLFLFFISIVNNINAATYYIRTNGGTAVQCNGNFDVDYSLAASPNCAYNGDLIQLAVDNAVSGDFIKLQAGQTFVESDPFTPIIKLKDKGNITEYITITTNGAVPSIFSTIAKSFRIDSNAVQSYTRLTPAMVSAMPKIKTSNGFPVLFMDNRANHYKIIGLELTTDNAPNQTTISLVGGEESTIENIPHHITFDSCFLHPSEEDGTFNNLHSRSTEMAFEPPSIDNFEIKNCVVQGFTGWDAASVWIGNIPISGFRLNANSFLSSQASNGYIHDSILEANGQIFLGGGGTDNPAHIGTCNNWTSTSTNSCTNTLDLEIGTVFRVFSNGLNNNHRIPDNSHNMTALVQPVGPYANAKVTAVNHTTGAVTFTNLTTGFDYRRFWTYFFDATGGTFTLTWMGQTTAPINYPVASITNATNTSPITITTSSAHGFSTGDRVYTWGIGGNILANGFKTITVTGSNTFTINSDGSGTYTGGGNVVNHTILENNTLAALEALSNVAPGDVSVVYSTDWDNLFINFNGGAWAYPVPINKLIINGSGLIGANDPAYVVDSFSESYHPLENSQDGTRIDIPLNGAEIAWKGYQSHDILIERNIIAQPKEWLDAGIGTVKGFVENKGADHVTWNANIFAMRPTGFVYTVRNQGGAVPWASNAFNTFTNNIFTETGYVFALVMTDGTYESDASTNTIVSNNLFLFPGGRPNESQEFSHLQGGGDVLFDHNTMFFSREFTRGIGNPTNRMPGLVFTNNIFRPAGPFFFGCFDGTDCFPGSTGSNNLVVNNLNLDSDVIQGFFNELGVGAGWVETDETSIFTSVSPRLISGETNFDGGGNYRIKTGSLYKSGGTRQATDGKDIGVDYTLLINALGFDPFTTTTIKKCNWHANPRCTQ